MKHKIHCAPSTEDAPTSSTEPSAAQPVAESPKTEGEQKIVVWAWDPNFNVTIMKEAAAKYKEKNPNVTVEVAEMAKADVEQKLHTVLAAKTTNELPDVVLIEDYNAQKYLQSYPGAFPDLTNQIDYNNFASYKVALMTLQDKVYGVPFDSGVTGFFYRKDLLEQAGYKAEDLKDITWDKFIEIGKDVKAKTGKVIFGFDKADGGLIRIMLNSTGEWYFTPDGKANIANNEALKEAMENYKKIMEADIIKPASGWNEWVATFNNGEGASVVTGAWIIGSIKAAVDQSGKWALAPTPRLNNPTSVNASNLGGSSWYILENSKNKDAALDFMKNTFASNVDFYQTILEKNGAIASFLPAQQGEKYQAPDAFFDNQPIFAELGSYMKQIPSINFGLYTYEADAAIMAQIDDILSGKKMVEQALKDAETQVLNQIQ